MHTILIHLNLINAIGPSRILRLMKAGLMNDALYNFSAADFVQLGISAETAAVLVEGLRDKKALETELALIAQHDIKIVTIIDDAYPSLLREITSPPAVLYYKGVLPDERSLAMIGARKADGYAKEVAHFLVPELTRNGWSIISGGAAGADTFAHEAALAAGGKTTAILGSGLLKPYPAANKKLFERIVAQGGCMMSAFSLLTLPEPFNFPARNRIISGLSRGCIVLQAAVKSGAAITARFALDQGRDVFAVPGLISNPLSGGCHALVKEGAKLVQSAHDILVEYDLSLVADEKAKQLTLEPVDEIIGACSKPASLEDLMEAIGISFDALNMRLFSLQLEGKIEQNHAGLWQAVR